MAYPGILTPTSTERVELQNGRIVDIPNATPVFNRWGGQPPGDLYRGKPILSYNDRPAFAELVILWSFLDAGWEGAWIDTFGRRVLMGFWPPQVAVLPHDKKELLARLTSHGGTAWDVLCWSSDHLVFAESKRHRKDSIRQGQVKFLENALEGAISPASFLLVEWDAA